MGLMIKTKHVINLLLLGSLGLIKAQNYQLLKTNWLGRH
jgi:hypothetical protein